MSYSVEQLPHCDLLRLILSTERFVLSARQLFNVGTDMRILYLTRGSIKRLPWYERHSAVCQNFNKVQGSIRRLPWRVGIYTSPLCATERRADAPKRRSVCVYSARKQYIVRRGDWRQSAHRERIGTRPALGCLPKFQLSPGLHPAPTLLAWRPRDIPPDADCHDCHPCGWLCGW